MRISELSRRSEVPVATIKFYLREHLLPEGQRTSATQAQYGEAHVERLRLIRALVGPAELSLAAVRKVIAAIEDPPAEVFDLLGAASTAVERTTGPQDHTRVHELVARWGWLGVEGACPLHGDLAAALAALDQAGVVLSSEDLRGYAEHIGAIAEAEIAAVPTDSPEAAVRYVVLGTVLVEPLLLALRRLAHVEFAGRRFGGPA
ncbi:MerR family transcriptional regulator [uncultured Friedmanniella sp.]|uniref:MerR family transcriptional regulator n=1 Tax=uncultured Friedmanniella sp. TaxID=335381 RepID=UPI0035C97797